MLFSIRRLDGASMSMSSRSGNAGVAAPTAGAGVLPPPPVRLKKSGVASIRRDQNASRTITVPLSTGAVSVPLQRQVGVDGRDEAFRVADPHPLAGGGQVQLAQA